MVVEKNGTGNWTYTFSSERVIDICDKFVLECGP